MTTQPLSSQMHDYISTATPQEITALLNAINATHSQSPEAHPSQTLTSEHEHSVTPPRRVRAAEKDKPQGVKKKRSPARSPRSSKQATSPERTTMRPLNSFFAFRSYYSRMFINQQQKDISCFLTTLWHTDMQKAKFSLIAKAYSVLRDLKGKEQTPLDEFLALTCSKMEIVPPEQYLATFGWQVQVQAGSKSILTRSPHGLMLKEELFTSTLSVDDLIAYCKEVGYVTEDVSDQGVPKIGNHIPALTMASLPSQHHKFKSVEQKTNRSTTTSPMLSSVSPSPQHVTRPPRELRGPLPPSMPFYTPSAGAHIFSPHGTTYHTHQQPHVFDDISFPFTLPSLQQPMPSLQQPAHRHTNIDPRLIVQQDSQNPFNNTSQVLPDTLSNTVRNLEATSSNDLSSFNTNNYSQHFLPNGSDEFLFEPLAIDRFDANNISSFSDMRAFGADFFEVL